MADFVDYMKDNLWLPVVIALGIALVLIIIMWIICRCRKRSRYDYSVLEEERSLIQKWDDDRRMQQMAERDALMLNCYYYLKDSDKYNVVDHLPEIGSRKDKQWFLVHDKDQQINAVLSMVPWNVQSVICYNKATRRTLGELFTLLQHPYLFPVLDVDFVFKHGLVMLTQPFRSGGSLKDVIYGSRPRSSWEEKYQKRGKALSLTQIRNYSRQILEALLYLKEKGFPPQGHLHSGNVFVVNGTCKLSGYENSLFGWSSRIYPCIKKLLKDNYAEIEVISFGHLLFEMVSGYELTTTEPKREQLVKFRCAPVVEVINFIFFNDTERVPTLEELVSYPFFKGGDISGLSKFNPGPVRFSPNVKQLLKLYRRENENGQRVKRKLSKRSKSEDGEAGMKERKHSKSKGKRNSMDQSALPAVHFQPHTSYAPTPILPKPPSTAPPPPPPPIPGSSQMVSSKPPSTSGRGALLSQIHKGTKLRPTKTVDKSAPRL